MLKRKDGTVQGGRWSMEWIGTDVFKVDMEGMGLRDDNIEDWALFMDAEFERSFGDRWPASKQYPNLTASCLNFSRNGLTDRGVILMTDYLRRRNIVVQSFKLFKNGIGDEGARSIGLFLTYTHQPVHEIHLSHNHITELGAWSILDAAARSLRYPYEFAKDKSPRSVVSTCPYSSDEMGRRDPSGLAPLWLRLERNAVDWSSLEAKLVQAEITWCTADSRDSWLAKGQSQHDQQVPMICMHSAYRSQRAAFKHHDRSVRHGGDVQLSDDVPMYIFLDASATLWMLINGDCMFSFAGLVRLCQLGHMKCTREDSEDAKLDESQRIIFVITDSILIELRNASTQCAEESQRLNWLLNCQDSYFKVCRSLGILEVLETEQYTQLQKLSPRHEELASEMQISKKTVKTFDFACLWESQIEAEGRVFFLTADRTLKQFATKLRDSVDWKALARKPLSTLHAADLEQSFVSDCVPGCRNLDEAAIGQLSTSCKIPMLTASLMASVVNATALLHDLVEPQQVKTYIDCGDQALQAEVDCGRLRYELSKALSLFASVQDSALSKFQIP